MLSQKDREEMHEILRDVLDESMPKLVSELSAKITADLDKRFELLGLAAETHLERQEVRKDMEFVRLWRKTFNFAASRVGGSIITAALLGLAGLAGYGAWLKGWWLK